MRDGALDGVAVVFAKRCSPFSGTLASEVQGLAPLWVLLQRFVSAQKATAPTTCSTHAVQCLPCADKGWPVTHKCLCHHVVCD